MYLKIHLKKAAMLCLLVFLAACTGQNPNDGQEVSEKPAVDTMPIHDHVEACKCIDTLVVDEQNSLPPFNSSARILSYEFKDTVIDRYDDIIKGGHLQRKYIVKEIDLTKVKKQLEKILFNKVERCVNEEYRPLADCGYNPHHCIVFYNKKGKATDFIEICFICDKVSISRKSYFGPFCGNTFCELRKLLTDAGHNKNSMMSIGPPCD